MMWQTLLLLLIVCGFGTAVYIQSVENIFSQIDTELLGGARVLEGTIRAFTDPPSERDLGRRGRRPPHRPPRRLSEEDMLRREDFPPLILQLPIEMMRGPGRRDQVYFVVFDFDGNVIQSSPNAETTYPKNPHHEYHFRFKRNNREVVLRAPGRTMIVVGRTAEKQRAQLNSLSLMLALSATVVMAVGLLGAWWLTGRAIRPIEKLSQTADAITADNLKDRIDVAQLDDEFKSVSLTINSMVDRLATAIEQQRKFTADASHELRTPISILQMHAELALAKQRDEEEYRKSLETCLRASERMNRLTEDLLELARSDSGQLILNKSRVDLLKIAQDSVAFFASMADSKKVELNVEVQPAYCVADRDRIRQFVDNILKNAIIHNVEGGHVNVTVNQANGKAIIRVENSGPPIPAEHIPHLFDRFYRVDSARHRTRDSKSGSGLGLSICKMIADAHDATIEINSSERDGTVVIFSIKASND